MATPPLADKVKLWLFPGLVSILGLIIWSDLQTIKTKIDINTATSLTNKADINNLNNRVNRLESLTDKQPKLTMSNDHIPGESPKDTLPLFVKIVAIKPEDKDIIVKNINKTTL